MINKFILSVIVSCIFNFSVLSQGLEIGVLKYRGGGDWYANPTSLPNLVKFCNKHINTNISKIIEVDPSTEDIFKVPFIHTTGHGNIVFNKQEIKNIRNYLFSGGFWHIDDNYGLDPYIRRELKKIFPNKKLVELPFTHPIYHQVYDFDKGLPKIHRHDGLPPQGFAIIDNGRVIVFYTYECDLGNGWEDTSVYHDSEQKHIDALKMGANIIKYAFHN